MNETASQPNKTLTLLLLLEIVYKNWQADVPGLLREVDPLNALQNLQKHT